MEINRNLTPSEYKLLSKKPNKFGAKRSYRCQECGGWATKVACLTCQSQKVTVFASKAEAKEYDRLREREKRGDISRLELQPAYPIYIKGKLICKVVLDFKYLEHGIQWVVVDVKGHDNALSRLKRKMVEAAYDIKVELVK